MGTEYPVRDGTGEWGAFRAQTIEALSHVGKVTGEEEVKLEDGRWVPILSVPELHRAVTGEAEGPSDSARATAAPEESAPEEVAPDPPPVEVTEVTELTEPVALTEPVESAPPDSPEPGVTAALHAAGEYEVIKADGTMLTAMPLPSLIAQVRDGQIGPEDLVAGPGGSWAPAKTLAQLKSVFASGVRVTGPTSSKDTSSPPPRAATPPPRSRTPAPRPPADPQDLSGTPFGEILGQLVRARASGRLVVNGAGGETLTTVFKDGHPIASSETGHGDRTATGQFMLALGPDSEGPQAATAARSAAAVTDVLSAFQRASGAWRFDRVVADQPPQFWVHPWELQRAGFALDASGGHAQTLTETWGTEVIALPGVASIPAMPLSEGESAALALVDGSRTFNRVLQLAGEQGLDREAVRRTLIIAKNLGLASVGYVPAVAAAPSSPSPAPPSSQPRVPAVADVTTGAAAFSAGGDPAWVLGQLRALDDAAVLGVPPGATEADVQAAYVGLLDCLKDFAGDADTRNQVMQRINVAHRGQVQAAKLGGGASAPVVEPPPPLVGEGPRPPEPDRSVPTLPQAPQEPPPADSSEKDEMEVAMAAAMGAEGSDSPPVEEIPDAANKAARSASAGAASPKEEKKRVATPSRGDARDQKLERNFVEAQALIEKRQWAAAQKVLRRLVQVAPLDGRFHGWLGYCVYEQNRKAKNAAKKAADELEQATRLRPEDPELFFLLGSVLGDAGDVRKAERAFQEVLKLDPKHEAALAELKGVSDAKRKKRRPKGGPEGEPKELWLALAFFGVVCFLCFAFANMIGHDASIQDPHWRGFGEKEYFLYPDNWWFWARRLLLVAAAMIGLKLVHNDDVIQSVKPVEFGVLGFLYGGGYGFISAFVAGRQWPPDQEGALILPMGAALIGMVLFHAISEELFFRRLLTRMVQRVVTNVTAGAAISGLAFGLYHLTYTAFFWGLKPWNPEFPAYSMPMQVLSQAMTWGLPLALLFYWSRSIGPSLVANVMFGATYVGISFLRATGAL